MSGVWRGTVTRTTAPDGYGNVYVVVARLTGTTEHGPLEPLYNTPLLPGTAVLVGLLEGDPNRLVLLRRF